MDEHSQMNPSGATNSRISGLVKQPHENTYNMNHQEKPRYLSHSIDQIVESIPRNTPPQPTQHSVTNLIYQPHNLKDNSTTALNEVPVNYCTDTVKPSSLPLLSFPLVNTLDRQYYPREILGGGSFEPLLNFSNPYSPLTLNATKDYTGMKKIKYTSLDADTNTSSIGYKDTGLTMLSNLAHSRSPISDSGEERSSERVQDDGIIESKTCMDSRNVSEIGSAVESDTVEVTSNEIILNFTSGHDVIVEDRRVLDDSNSDLMFYGEGQDSLGSFEKHHKHNEEYKILHIVSNAPFESSENTMLGNSQIIEDKAKSLCIELSTSDQDFNLCAEDRQVEKFIYNCGACDLVFGTLCNLHFHLDSHGSNGSYFFDRSTWTAYPRFDVVDVGVQIYTDDIERDLLVDVSMDNTTGQIGEQVLTVGNNVNIQPSDIITGSDNDMKENLDQDKDIEDKEAMNAFDSPKVADIHINVTAQSTSVPETEEAVDQEDLGHVQKDISPPQKKGTLPPRRQISRKNAKSRGKKSGDGLNCIERDMTETCAINLNKHNELKETNEIPDKSTKQIPDKLTIRKGTVKKINHKWDAQLEKSTKATPSAGKYENFKCSDCEKCFNLPMQLKRHMERVHGIQKTFQCKTCSSEFTSKDELTMHRQEHKTQSHKCDICEKVVTTAASLRDHLNYHMGVKPHKCETCGKEFR